MMQDRVGWIFSTLPYPTKCSMLCCIAGQHWLMCCHGVLRYDGSANLGSPLGLAFTISSSIWVRS